jgi:hypothetical protein
MPKISSWYANGEDSRPTFKRRFHRFSQIVYHPADAWLTIRILTWACVLPFLKQIVPLKRLAQFMWSEPRSSKDPHLQQKISTVVRWIYIFLFPNETSCLERCLLLYRFLSRNKKDPSLVTGMRRTEGCEWKGHAWIEVDGRPFDEDVAHVQDFRALMIFGPNGVMKQDTRA